MIYNNFLYIDKKHIYKSSLHHRNKIHSLLWWANTDTCLLHLQMYLCYFLLYKVDNRDKHNLKYQVLKRYYSLKGPNLYHNNLIKSKLDMLMSPLLYIEHPPLLHLWYYIILIHSFLDLLRRNLLRIHSQWEDLHLID